MIKQDYDLRSVAKHYPSMKDTLWRIGVFLGLYFIILTVVTWLFTGGWETHFFESFLLLVFLLSFNSILICIRNNIRSGAVLLDLGQFKGQKWIYLVAGLCVIILGIFELSAIGTEVRLMDICIPVVLIMSGPYCFMLGLSHIQIRENGISHRKVLFLKWEEIKNVDWKGIEGTTLTLGYQRRCLIITKTGTLKLNIPFFQRLAVDELLRKYVKTEPN